MIAVGNALLTRAEILATVFGGLILTIVATRTVYQIARTVTTFFALAIGPFALHATRSAKDIEIETQGA